MIFNHIGSLICYSFIASVFYIPFRYIFIKKKKREFKFFNEFWLFVFSVFIVGIIPQTVFPIIRVGVTTESKNFYFDIYFPSHRNPNFLPFKSIGLFWNTRDGSQDMHAMSFMNLVGNILLFLPIGFIFPLAFPNHKKFKYTFFYCLCGIFLIEFCQFFVGRVADIDDLILNMTGIIIGYAIFALCSFIYKFYKHNHTALN